MKRSLGGPAILSSDSLSKDALFAEKVMEE